MINTHKTAHFLLRVMSKCRICDIMQKTTLQWSRYIYSSNNQICLLLPSATKLRQGNIFTSVCHSVHRGCIPAYPAHAGIHPLGRHPSRQTPPFLGRHPLRRPLQRTVRILLECILVDKNRWILHCLEMLQRKFKFKFK